jgi:signal transduction histidine kinase
MAVLWTDIFGRILPLLFALCYLPYPFAPADKRSPYLTWGLTFLGVITALHIMWNNGHSPYPDPDWRRSIQLLRPTDLAHFWTHLPMFLGFLLAAAGLLVTALSTSLRHFFEYLALYAPSPLRPAGQKLAQAMQQAYGDCHPGIIIVFQYQFVILLLFVFLDAIPVSLGVSGHGYNLLWFCMPISYLLLHTNFQALRRIYYWLQLVLGTVFLLQLATQYTHWQNHTFGLGSNAGDWATLFVMLGGIVIAALLAIYPTPLKANNGLQLAMDNLFLQPSSELFWNHLTQVVGGYVGVSTWLWLQKGEQGEWQIVKSTSSARPRWLHDPLLQQILTSNNHYQRPLNVVVDTMTLPTTLILLPIVQHQTLSEIIVAANPAQVENGSFLLDNPVFYNRLISAVHALHSHEQQIQMITQQQQLTHYQQHLAQAYRELHRQQRNSTRSTNLLISATLHDQALQRLAGVVQHLRHHPAGDDAMLEPVVQECLAIDHEIRRVLRDLRPKGSEQQLGAVLEDAVSQWEFQHRSIHFVYNPPAILPWLTELHRVSLFLIVNQAVENALEHAHPRTISLVIENQITGLNLTIQDDGVGFEYNTHNNTIHSLGLLLMHDIAEEIGAKLTISTRPGAGCCVSIFMPLTPLELAHKPEP